jgi:hypothetical protein
MVHKVSVLLALLVLLVGFLALAWLHSNHPECFRRGGHFDGGHFDGGHFDLRRGLCGHSIDELSSPSSVRRADGHAA